MDFFRSVFADEPDPPAKSTPDSPSSPDQEHQQSISDPDSDSPPNQQSPNPNPDEASTVGGARGWSSFGGLIKTLTTKSESVIETYRRDLKEFSTGLRKEIEVAQGSLEHVGQAIDEIGSSVIKNTADIISHGKEAILALEQEESDSSDSNVERGGGGSSTNSLRYSRFDAQVRVIQGDTSTYCEEPDDLEDYGKWKSSEFVIEECRDEIISLLEGNGAVDAIYRKVVPGVVDEETFWSRYYYRIHKLKQAEALRANLVKRAISAEEEDLSWDVDDEDEEEGDELKANENQVKEDVKSRDLMEVGKLDGTNEVEEKNPVEDKKSEETVIAKEEEPAAATATVEEPKVEEKANDATATEKVEATAAKSAENSGSEGNGGNGGSCKDSDYSVVSSHQTTGEEEDLGWDEIEDLSSIDDNKKEEMRVSAANKEELRKRLSVAEEEEEDLSWDIEDDDEPVKA
ncbi:BSD domain-containing protein 1 [Linum grandiflorum]